jgi:rhodanese-related sulfurtransferase
METTRRILIILAIAAATGAAANALSPRGLSWSRPLGRGIAAQVTDAGMVPVGLEDVRKMVAANSARLIDARKPELFAIGRLPGALNVPWDPDAPPKSIPPRDKPLILYCDNEFCEQSLRLGLWLRSKGVRDIAVFVDGYEAWWNARGAVDQD